MGREIDQAHDRARRVLWSGMTGPHDTDGETSQWVDVSDERVVEYQTAAGVRPLRRAPASALSALLRFRHRQV